jgi:hypothetical protein
MAYQLDTQSGMQRVVPEVLAGHPALYLGSPRLKGRGGSIPRNRKAEPPRKFDQTSEKLLC